MESFASTFQMPIVIASNVESTTPTTMLPGRRQPAPPSPLPMPQPGLTPAAPQHRRPAASSAAAAATSRTYSIYVRPDYANAVFALIRHFNWKHVYYLYDTEQGLSLSLSLSLLSYLCCTRSNSLSPPSRNCVYSLLNWNCRYNAGVHNIHDYLLTERRQTMPSWMCSSTSNITIWQYVLNQTHVKTNNVRIITM